MSLQTALVVDDSKLARITLQRLLEKHNLQVQLAESGVHALEMLKTNLPDIIFMDHLMPELDGFEATKKIKADPQTSHIPVIMCTGKEGKDNYDAEARAIGASGTLFKPPQAEKLAMVIESARSGTLTSVAIPQEAEPVAETVEEVSSEIVVPTPMPEYTPPQPQQAVVSASDWEILVDRLDKLEKNSRDFPSFDGFESRLRESESELSTLRQDIQQLRDQPSETPEQSQPDFGAMAEQLREELMPGLEKRVQQVLEAHIASIEPAEAPAAPAIDEVQLAATITRDVEQTLTPLLDAELKSLEDRLLGSIDDAVSESRRDLDVQLRETVNDLEMRAKPVPEAPDLDDLIERIRPQVMDIATHSATATMDNNVEDRLSAWEAELQSAKEELKRTLIERTTRDEPAPSLNIEDILNDKKLHTLIEGTVEELLRGQISKQGQDLVQQIAKALREQMAEKQSEIDAMATRVEQLERQKTTLATQLNNLQNVKPPKSGGAAAMVIGGVAVVLAIVSLLKGFGVF
ncbi:response regulator [Hahella sp. NBU794]|uniref:response regulator n=1 Tax=Hahella sp. NBU794 TaxID=3422590 RepID=UPI003D6FD190